MSNLINLDDCLFVLTNEDAQLTAQDILGRKLDNEELALVYKGVQNGLEWADVLRTSIEMAVKFK